MNFDWISFLIGLILGWLLEWIIDWLYWRKGRVDADALAALQSRAEEADDRLVELEAELAGAKTDLDAWQTKYYDLEAESDVVESVRAELAQCQNNYALLEAEYAQLQADHSDLQNAADEARIRAIGRLTAIDGIDEETAGRLFEAGISGSDDLLISEDSALQAALGYDDDHFADWSRPVKAGLAALGAGFVVSELGDEEDEDEEALRAAVVDLDLEEEGEDTAELGGDLIVESRLETYDFDEDGEVDLVVETTTEGFDIDGDGEIDIVLEELIEADILDEDAVAAAELELENEIDAELEALVTLEDELESEEEEDDELQALAVLEGAVVVEAMRTAAAIDLAAEPDDLTRIQGIGPRFSEKLAAYGILTYAALAEASDEDLDGAIEPKNWQKVDYDSWRDQARVFADVPLPRIEGDDLQLIEGIGPKYSTLLREADILTFAELADSEPARLAVIIGAPAWRNVDYTSWIARLAWPRRAARRLSPPCRRS